MRKHINHRKKQNPTYKDTSAVESVSIKGIKVIFNRLHPNLNSEEETGQQSKGKCFYSVLVRASTISSSAILASVGPRAGRHPCWELSAHLSRDCVRICVVLEEQWMTVLMLVFFQ